MTLRAELTDQWAEPLWRLNNLYAITDKDGRRVDFTMNTAQEALFREMHNQNVILKARQRGFKIAAVKYWISAQIRCVFLQVFEVDRFDRSEPSSSEANGF